MSDKLDFYLKNTSFECPICHYHSGKLWEVVNPPKNGGPSRVGHIFVSCSNRADACRATTFFGPNPPTISSIGTIGNRKIGIWKAWSPQDGPKRLPEDTNDTYVRPVATGKRKRSSAAEEEEEEERPVKRRRQDTETDAKVKYLEEQLLKLTSKQQPSKKKSPPKKPAPVEDSIEEEEEDLEEGEIKAPYTQYSPEVTDELEDEESEEVEETPTTPTATESPKANPYSATIAKRAQQVVKEALEHTKGTRRRTAHNQ
jgi:hypothetical protein